MNEPGQFQTPPPHQPPPGQPQYYYVPAYQPPPRPPRKPVRTAFKIIMVLFVVFVFGVIGLFVLGSFLSRFRGEDGFGLGDRIGLVRIDNAIMQGPESQFWLKTLKDLAENDRVKGIVVRIDSPGGTVGASQEIYSAVRYTRDRLRKKVWISMGDVAASGGYYIASAGERIYANKGTLTGSIGVILSKPDISVLSERIGFTTENIKSGKFKDSGTMMRKLSPEEQAMFQGLIDNTYMQFVNDVYDHRESAIRKALKSFPDSAWTAYGFNRPASDSADATTKTLPLYFLKQIADGRVYTGEQALDLGLVDKIGSLDDAVREMHRELGLEGKPRLLEPKQRRGLFGTVEAKIDDILPKSHSPLSYRMDW